MTIQRQPTSLLLAIAAGLTLGAGAHARDDDGRHGPGSDLLRIAGPAERQSPTGAAQRRTPVIPSREGVGGRAVQ